MEGEHYVQETVVFYQKTCKALNLIFKESFKNFKCLCG